MNASVHGRTSTPVPGVIVRPLRRTNLWPRGGDIGHRDLEEDNVGRLHPSICRLRQPTLVPGADAGHYTRGRVCSPNARLSARFSEMPSERCSRPLDCKKVMGTPIPSIPMASQLSNRQSDSDDAVWAIIFRGRLAPAPLSSSWRRSLSSRMPRRRTLREIC